MDHGGLQATTVPALSSFKSGHAEWKILRMEERTQVTYQAQMEPDFFIPPLIGSYFVKQKLRKSMLASLARIECIARIQAGLERNPGLDPVLVADDDTRRSCRGRCPSGGPGSDYGRSGTGGRQHSQ